MKPVTLGTVAIPVSTKYHNKTASVGTIKITYLIILFASLYWILHVGRTTYSYSECWLQCYNENVYCLCYQKGHEMYGPVCMFNKMKQQHNETAPHVNIVNG